MKWVETFEVHTKEVCGAVGRDASMMFASSGSELVYLTVDHCQQPG